ncbi:ABC transporter substrate-binding protein [Arthrobacter sp. MDB2-24]
MRHRRLAAVVAAVTALTLGGCSSSGDTGSGETEAIAQTLQLPLSTAPGNFQIGNWPGGEAYMFLSVYDTIVGRDVDGSVVPAIAETWEYSEDQKTLTFKIREDMTFTDGEPINATAVAASLEVARTGPSTASSLTRIAGVEAPDESTVVLTLSEPDAALLPILSGTIGAIGSPKVLTEESSKLKPVGSGPYVIDDSSTTVGAVYTLKRNPEYWNAEAYPYDTVEFRVIEDPVAQQNAMQAGQLDFINIPADQKSQYPEDKFTVGEGTPSGIAALWLIDRNGDIIPALSDKRVRQAINMALDRALIAESLGQGGLYPSNQLVSPRGEVFSEDLLKVNDYDPEAAKELLAEAGYADGFEMKMPSTALTTQFESAIAQALGDIGITVTWEPIQFQDLFPKIFTGNYGAFFFYNGLTSNDAQDLTASLVGLFNTFNHTTPELTELMKAANSAPVEEQADALRAINEYLVEDGWAAPIGYTSAFYAVTKDVTYTAPLVNGQTVLPFAPAGS